MRGNLGVLLIFQMATTHSGRRWRPLAGSHLREHLKITNFKIATGIRTIQNVFRDHHHETQNNVQFFSNQSRQMLFLCFVVMKIDPKNHEKQNNVQFFSSQSRKMLFLCFVFRQNNHEKQNNVQFFSNQSRKMLFLFFVFRQFLF